jgi:ATP-dependent Clp protease ATP-binding subunit ClpB
MTTNAGANITSSQAGFGSADTDMAKERTEKALLSFLRPEFINRIDEVITFRSLDEENFRQIAKIMLDDLKQALAERNISFVYTDEVCDYIAKESFSKRFGARNMRRYIQSNVEDKLAEAMIFVIKGNISMASVSISDGKIKVDCV